MLKSGLLLTLSNASIALLGMIRNILIARLISVEDFGIAATFAITMALVEMTSNLAIDRFVVQASDGDSARVQATAQAMQAARGLLASAVLFMIAGPLATLFGIPQAVHAYQLIAVVPLLRGLAHLDIYRLHRQMRFLPSIKTDIAAISLSTLAAVPLALQLGDYRAMLYGILLQQALFTMASHMVAERPYRWRWDSAVVRRAFNFGWPLMLNGLLMFGIFQGDRIIVGSLMGMSELGWFSAAFTLTIVPTLVVARTLNTFFLPQLSRVQDDPEAFHRLYLVTMQAALLAGVLLAMFFAIAGPALMLLLYGAKYEPALGLIGWLGVMQGVRMMRQGPSVVAMATAHTRNPLVANVMRSLALLAALIAAKLGYGIVHIVFIGIVGEFLALAASVFLLARWSFLDLRKLTIPCMICTAVLATIVGNDLLGWLQFQHPGSNHYMLATSVLLVLWFMPDLRRWLWSLLIPLRD